MAKTKSLRRLSLLMILSGLVGVLFLHVSAGGRTEIMQAGSFLLRFLTFILQMIAGTIGLISYSPRASLIAGWLEICVQGASFITDILQYGLLMMNPLPFLLPILFLLSAQRWLDCQRPATYRSLDV